MEECETLIIGAGAAGLAAARAISEAGLPVAILEARDRIGGRIHTIRTEEGNLPIELGAEFVHGERNATWEVIRAAGLETHEVPDGHLQTGDGELREDQHFWNELDKVMSRIDPQRPDLDFESFLTQAEGVSPRVKQLAREYVEGFHAAPANRISIQALAKAEQAAERDSATRQFRIASGYAAMLDWFEKQLVTYDVRVSHRTVVRKVRWRRHRVEVTAQTPDGPRTFQTARALFTLPLGVLKHQNGPGTVAFEPRLKEKERAIAGLEMGAVVKVTFQFRSRFWPIENFGFLQAADECLPTWWTDQRGPVLTGWAGGTRAERLLKAGPEKILTDALTTLGRAFRIQLPVLRKILAQSCMHNWSQDAFSGGAYSYTPVGMVEMPGVLAAPVEDTLFFAGEATDIEGEQGTVHAALASGCRAAREILRCAR